MLDVKIHVVFFLDRTRKLNMKRVCQRKSLNAKPSHENWTSRPPKNSKRSSSFKKSTSKKTVSKVSSTFFSPHNFQLNLKVWIFLLLVRMVLWIWFCDTWKYQLVAEFNRSSARKSNDTLQHVKVTIKKMLFSRIFEISYVNMFDLKKWKHRYWNHIFRWWPRSEPFQSQNLLHMRNENQTTGQVSQSLFNIS
jgi:hypothetical protein